MSGLNSRLFARILSRNREAYILKIITLAIAFATSVLIILFSLNEFGFDKFHRDANRVFRVLQKNTDEQYSGNRLSARIPQEVFAHLKNESYHDHLVASRVKIMNKVAVVADGESFRNQRIHAADPEILNIFSFDVLDGDIQRFGPTDEITAILSSHAAEKYTGTREAAGKKLNLFTFGDTIQIRIVAVFNAFPNNSHEDFDVFIAFNDAALTALNFDPEETGVYGRALLTSPRDVVLPDAAEFRRGKMRYSLQPLPELYFGPRVLGEEAKHGDQYSVVILLCIASLILFLSISSFINLTTLTLPYRSKEIAIKKLAGTSQRDILLGFLKESSVVVAISFVIGLSIILSVAEFANDMLNIQIVPLLLAGDIGLLITVAVLFTVFSVSPVLMTMRFAKADPKRLLSTDTITFPELKRIITFLQLGISIFLIIASVVVRRQINYSLVKEPGQNHDQIVFLNSPAGITNEGVRNLRSGWRQFNPNILDVMAVSQLPDRITSKEIGTPFYLLQVDAGFLEFFGLDMEEGYWFGPNTPDSMIVVNRAGRELIGKRSANVIGIAEDINGVFSQPQKPVKISIGEDFHYNWLCVRVLEVDIRRTIEQLSKNLSVGSEIAHVSYLSNHFESWVNYQDRLNKLSALLTIVSGLLSCFAIYGLSVSLVRDKLKEIAVRKLFGAHLLHITYVLVREFAKQMLIALVVFGPVAYILLNELLRTFVYSTEFMWLDPVYPVVYCVFTIITICGFQAMSLNRTNFASALKG